MLKQKWQVERNNNIRQIVTSKTIQLVAHNLSKEIAFHIIDLHNEWLDKKEKELPQ